MRTPRSIRGYSYLEVLVAAIILAVALVPAAESLRAASDASHQVRQRVPLQYEALGYFENLMANSLGALEAEAIATGGTAPSTLYSEPVGTPERMLVTVSPHDIDDADGDGDTLTGTESGVVHVRLEVEGQGIVMETVVGSFL